MSGYSLKQFVTDTEENVRKFSQESQLLRNIRVNLETLLEGKIQKDAFISRADRYAMNLVFMPKDAAFSIIAAVWQPGQTTPIHDHLTWALVGAYEGKERESIFKRIDDLSSTKVAKLELVSERTNEKGHVTVLGKAGIHRVDNLSAEPAWSIHVYGRDIGNEERHSYDPVSGEISTFRSGYCNVLRDLEAF